ncbi:MAG: hypothetical protein ABW321_18415 [Polyangiales bacterium]
MTELDPEARALIVHTRLRDGPTAADRARLRERLAPLWAAERAAQSTQRGLPLTAARGRLRWITALLLATSSFWRSDNPASHSPAPVVVNVGDEAARLPADGMLGATAGPTPRLEDEKPPSVAQDGTALQSAPGATVASRSPAVGSRGVRSHQAPPVAAAARRAAVANRDSRSVQPTAANAAATRAPVSETLAAAGTPLASGAKAATQAVSQASCQSGALGGSAGSPTSADLLGDRSCLHPAANSGKGVSKPERSVKAVAAGLAKRASGGSGRGDGLTPAGSDASAVAAGLVAPGRTEDIAPAKRAHELTPQAIDDELQWVGAARDALDRGQPSRALGLVQQHAFRYPQGALALERRAVQALALCALNRRTPARSVLADLQRLAPTSPLVARVRQRCEL